MFLCFSVPFIVLIHSSGGHYISSIDGDIFLKLLDERLDYKAIEKFIHSQPIFPDHYQDKSPTIQDLTIIDGF